MQPRVFDNVLPADLYDRLKRNVFAAPLAYGAKSNGKTDPHGHLSWKPAHDARENLADIAGELPPVWREVWDFMRAKRDLKLIRAYVNGYTYGMDGYFHTDSQRESEATGILYVCDKWDYDWGGETVVRDGDKVISVFPYPNRMLVFPSTMLHRANPVSRKCNGIRLVLVIKTRNARSKSFEQLSTWLVQHGACQLKHSDGSLHDHLVRCFAMLESRGVRLDVCFAGGLHSIYGTNAFQRQLVPPSPHGRAAVAGAFGQEAERLAYYFSLLDRPETLNYIAQFFLATDMPGQRALLRQRHSEDLDVSRSSAEALCLIECANLLDQGSLDRWPHLKQLWGQQHADGKQRAAE